jgi:hypothetical protein
MCDPAQLLGRPIQQHKNNAVMELNTGEDLGNTH